MPLSAVACIGVATLLFEILLTRIFSVTMWYHFAFVAISLALFGIAASGVAVTIAPRFFRPERALGHMGTAAFLFGVTVPIAFAIDLRIPFVPFDSAVNGAQPWLPYGLFAAKFLVLATPFFFSGLCIALAFTHAPARVNHIYCADLAGGGLGCALAVPLLLYLSGPSAILLAGVFPLCASTQFFRRAARSRAAATALAAAVVLTGFVAVNERFGVLAITRVKSYRRHLGQQAERQKAYEGWHPVSRVAVFPVGSKSSRSWFYAEESGVVLPPLMEVTNDAGARTFIWPKRSPEQYAELFRADVSDLVYTVAARPRVLVVGVGGGKDVLAALAFRARAVTGVELNPLMIAVVQERFGDFSGRPYDDPRVRIDIDEARNFVASRDERYDVIKVSVTDTWAASAAGAYALTESYLYTREAIEDFVSRLAPGGFLSITRWYPQETYRLVGLVAAALRQMGIQDPASRILMARNHRTLTLVLKNGTVTDEEEAAFTTAVDAAGLMLVHAPRSGPATPASADRQHQAMLETGGMERVAREVGLEMRPPTDDRPFFFNVVGFRSAEAHEYGARAGFVMQHGRALNLLIGLLKVSLAVALLFVVGPLLFVRREARERITRSGRLAANLYFLMLGLGYLLVEIPLLQRFILFLGHPTYAVTVVLFSLLATSGLGSLLAGRYELGRRRAAKVIFPAIAIVVFVSATFLPDVLRSLVGLPIGARVAVAVITIAPLGLLLGTPFPMGLGRAHAVGPSLVPWAWAVNGAASVAAPALAMTIAIVAGFTTALYAGGACYVVAAGAFLILERTTAGTAAAPSRVASSSLTYEGARL